MTLVGRMLDMVVLEKRERTVMRWNKVKIAFKNCGQIPSRKGTSDQRMG
jgi:hypothetical protein